MLVSRVGNQKKKVRGELPYENKEASGGYKKNKCEKVDIEGKTILWGKYFEQA